MIKLGYLTNQYPKVSHTFIRREIREIENTIGPITRLSIRQTKEQLVDEIDILESRLTKNVLSETFQRLTINTFKLLILRPTPFLKALMLAIALGRKSDKGIILNVIYFVEACTLFEWSRINGITHIHTHFGTNPTSVAMLCHQLGGPKYSFTVHGPEEFDRAIGINLRDKIKRAKFVVAISNFCASQLYRYTDHENWHKIKLVRCGVDEPFLEIPATPPLKRRKLVCIGRLCEQKGHLVLLEAIKQIAASRQDFRLTLIGDGELRGHIEHIIHLYNLEDLIDITGWASGEQIREHLLSSCAMVLPSFAEGLPVAIMEAFAACRPVISTYIAGIPELVIPGKNGWLVPAGAVDMLATAINEALDTSPEILLELGKRGKQLVEKNHSTIKEACKLADFFNEED